VVVVDRGNRPVDRHLTEICPVKTVELCVQVRKQSPLQQRIVAEINAWHHVPGMEGGLLGLGEEIVWIAIERQLPDALDWHQLFGPDLRGVQDVERESHFVRFIDNLDSELPLGETALVDRVPEITAQPIGVLAAKLLCLVPY